MLCDGKNTPDNETTELLFFCPSFGRPSCETSGGASVLQYQDDPYQKSWTRTQNLVFVSLKESKRWRSTFGSKDEIEKLEGRRPN